MLKPKEIKVDVRSGEEGLVRSPELHHIATGIVDPFKRIDEAYQADPRQYLTETIGDIEKVRIRETGREVTCSFIYDEETAKAAEVLVVWAPFSDVEPKSSVDEILAFLKIPPGEVSVGDRMHAQPHSYNQAIKSKTMHDLLKLKGIGMPVTTIFSPIHPDAYPKHHHKIFKNGCFFPAMDTVGAVLSRLEDRLHGPGTNYVPKVHLNGSSLGSRNALGAASNMVYGFGSLLLGSVTCQEMIIGPDKFPRLPRLADRFSFRQQIDKPPGISLIDDRPKIAEPQLRRDLGERGNELQMLGQMATAMSRWTFLQGLTKSRPAKRSLIDLDKAGIPVTIANAYNSGLTQETQEPLHIGDFEPQFNYQQKITVKAIENQRIGHELNELVTPTATIALAGIAHAAVHRQKL
jgi:hypothetical protein